MHRFRRVCVRSALIAANLFAAAGQKEPGSGRAQHLQRFQAEQNFRKTGCRKEEVQDHKLQVFFRQNRGLRHYLQEVQNQNKLMHCSNHQIFQIFIFCFRRKFPVAAHGKFCTWNSYFA